MHAWKIYDDLIDKIPGDLRVIDCLVGLHWTLVRSEWGTGAAMTMKGGRAGEKLDGIAGMPVKRLAGYVKSWDMVQASLGQAAINSVLNTPGHFHLLTGKSVEEVDSEEANGFKQFLPEISGKKVAVIGHFPGIESLAEICQLSIIERIPLEGDYPDTASEFLLPGKDYVFLTGTAFINKTMPRLIELSRNAKIILVGPSVPMSPVLFDFGVQAIASMVVVDETLCWRVIKEGGKMKAFKQSGKMVCLRRQ
ncbi:MAG: DUF364 domain-containing protein [Syntrophomonadaceae bacterium]